MNTGRMLEAYALYLLLKEYAEKRSIKVLYKIMDEIRRLEESGDFEKIVYHIDDDSMRLYVPDDEGFGFEISVYHTNSAFTYMIREEGHNEY